MAKHRYDLKRDDSHRLKAHRMFIAPRGITQYQPIDMRPQFPLPPFDQGDEGSCVANAGVGLATFLQAKLGIPVKMLSRQFLYYNTRNIEGTVSTDSGATITDTISAWAQFGICDESFDPYLPENMTATPTQSAYDDAKSDLAMNTAQISQDVDSIYATLAAGYPIDFGMDVYESFESDAVAQTGIVPLPKSDEQLLGGHSTLIVGIDVNVGICIGRNSWGTSWGQAGYYTIPLKYILSNHASDFWTVKQMPAPALLTSRMTLADNMQAVSFNILVVGGFLERVGDSSPIWKIADTLAAAGHIITRRAWTDVSAQDCHGIQAAITYSWGQAMFHKVYDGSPLMKHIILAGVPNPFLGEFLGSWTEPTTISSATDYQVDSFPISIVIGNTGAAFVNLNCDGPGVNHITLPAIEGQAVINEIEAMQAMVRSWQV